VIDSETPRGINIPAAYRLLTCFLSHVDRKVCVYNTVGAL